MNPCRYYVAVDFGSESMAACYIEEHLLEPSDIDLQAPAKTAAPKWELLKEDNDKPSKRLRTRIAIAAKGQALDDARLAQQIGVELNKSDFAYFHEPGQEYVRDLLPNLKLMYQAAIKDLLPKELHDATAERILQTVILQILNGIVFRDNVFLDYAKSHSGGLKGSMVHLLLTIPNVYSISHASKLRRFIGDHLTIEGEKVGHVETIYESDAIAHYLMWRRTPPPASIAAAMARIASAGKAGKRCNLATIDIGRGTTDVSFSTFEPSSGGWKYDLKARTGRAHGGGRLTYLIAEAIEQGLDQAFTAAAVRVPAALEAIKNHRLRLTGRSVTGQRQDATVISVAEQYIEAVKRHWTSDLRLETADVVHAKIADIVKTFEKIAKVDIKDDAMSVLLPLFAEAFKIPEMLPADHVPTFWDTLLSRKTLPPSGPFSGLRASVEKYVRENSDDVIDWMEEMVRADEGQSRGPFASLLRNTETIVLIAGQGGQFKPLREALKTHFQNKWNLNTESGGNVVFLDGAEAKYACCHGAVMQHRLPIENLRPQRIMGTYGFLSQSVYGGLKLVDMGRFQVEQQAQAIPLAKRDYNSFVYTPRHFSGMSMPETQLNALLAEGSALAYLWPIPHGGDVSITNLGDNGIQLVYEGDMGKQTVVRDDAAFGDVRTPGEDIYTRTWPEVLKPLGSEEQ